MRHRATISYLLSSDETDMDADTEDSVADYSTDMTDLNDMEHNSDLSSSEDDQDYLPNHYISQAQKLNSSDIIETDYAESVTPQLDAIEAQWNQ